ncbi:hypothetical protein BJ138DRAFT_300696 [Hygrophoropsis aurantiaca]|uniref:Uncharacterized protein n=1 Tax=Hygrophoropsis aurantiaca TaxID=72124 RepID=A0ACB8A754_9AGAM|nr:hypothetical protein BJ138DRAFT_300696 [Hygrophoropsis aurantiaca]
MWVQPQMQDTLNFEGKKEEQTEKSINFRPSQKQLAIIRKTYADDGDLHAIMETFEYRAIPQQPDLATDEPLSRNKERFHFRKPIVLPTCESGGILKYKNSLVKWSNRGLASGIVFSPSCQYDRPKKQWLKTKPDMLISQRKDIIYTDGRGWHYLGTYKRVSPCYTLPANKIPEAQLNGMVARSYPLANKEQFRMTCDMFKSGKLQARFFVVQCVGFHRDLHNQLTIEALKKKGRSHEIPLSMGYLLNQEHVNDDKKDVVS